MSQRKPDGFTASGTPFKVCAAICSKCGVLFKTRSYKRTAKGWAISNKVCKPCSFGPNNRPPEDGEDPIGWNHTKTVQHRSGQ